MDLASASDATATAASTESNGDALEPGPGIQRIDQLGTLAFRDTWYPMAFARDVKKKKPLARRLHGNPVVLWRSDDGAIRAMEDRCCHRRAPLSAGKVVDGTLKCAYHGWCYDGDGKCVSIPSQAGRPVPERFGVTTYPVVVRYGYAWMWWGDPANADPSLIPDVPFFHPDREPRQRVRVYYPAAHELVIENLLDLTHLDFVHGWVAGDPLGGEEEVEVDYTDEVVTMVRKSMNRKPPKAQAPMFGFPRRQNFIQTTRLYVRSGCAVLTAWYDPPGWCICLVNSNLPEGPTTVRLDGGLQVIGPRFYEVSLGKIGRIVARQDEKILGLQDPNYRLPDTRADKSVRGDAATLRYRSIRKALAERQARGDFSYRPGWQGEDAAKALRVERVH